MKPCKECKKNDTMQVTYMNVTHKIFKHEIKVINVPVIVCDCGHITYEDSRRLDFQLRDAYRNNLDTITYKID